MTSRVDSIKLHLLTQASQRTLRHCMQRFHRAFVFNVLELDNSRIRNDNKKIKCIKQLLEDNVILKPDKGDGVVIISRSDYKTLMETLCSQIVNGFV